MESTSNGRGLWIPPHIMGLEGLSAIEMLVLAEIEVLDTLNFERAGQGGCFAGNEHFSTRFGISKDSASRTISKLRDKGYIFLDLNMGIGCGRVIRINDELCSEYATPSAETPNPLGENAEAPLGISPNPLGKNEVPPLEKPLPPLGDFPYHNKQFIKHYNENVIKGGNETASSENTPSPKIKKESKTGKDGVALDLPFKSQEFAELWQEYLNTRKKKKWPVSESWIAPIFKTMAKYEEAFVIEILTTSTLGPYQGIFFSNTADRYDAWRKSLARKEARQGEVVLPYSSEKFKLSWSTWKEHLSQIGRPYESLVAEQITLDGLKEFDEEFSINLIKESAGKGKWTLLWNDTSDKYQQYKQRKHAHRPIITMEARNALFAPKPTPQL